MKRLALCMLTPALIADIPASLFDSDKNTRRMTTADDQDTSALLRSSTAKGRWSH